MDRHNVSYRAGSRIRCCALTTPAKKILTEHTRLQATKYLYLAESITLQRILSILCLQELKVLLLEQKESSILVPKFRINADGSIGERNDVECVGIEEKMGIHGNSTSSLAFGSKAAAMASF